MLSETNVPTGNIEVAGKVFKWSIEPVSPISAAHGLGVCVPPNALVSITCRQAAVNFSCRLKSNSNPRVIPRCRQSLIGHEFKGSGILPGGGSTTGG